MADPHEVRRKWNHHHGVAVWGLLGTLLVVEAIIDLLPFDIPFDIVLVPLELGLDAVVLVATVVNRFLSRPGSGREIGTARRGR
jgi:hypothetical protein